MDTCALDKDVNVFNKFPLSALFFVATAISFLQILRSVKLSANSSIDEKSSKLPVNTCHHVR